MTIASKQIFPPSLVPAGQQVVVRVSAGPTQVVPAPPPGFVTWVWWFRVGNEHTTLAADVTVQDAAGLVVAWQGTAAIPTRGAGALPAIGSTGATALGTQILSESALTAIVNSGGPCAVTAMYSYVKLPGFAQVVLPLTAAYQNVPLAPTNADELAVQFGQLGSYSPGVGNLPSNAAIMNNDTAIANAVFRYTRGAFVTEVTLANVAARARVGLSGVLPALLVGDVLELRVLTAPVVAGSVVVRIPYVRAAVQL